MNDNPEPRIQPHVMELLAEMVALIANHFFSRPSKYDLTTMIKIGMKIAAMSFVPKNNTAAAITVIASVNIARTLPRGKLSGCLVV